MTNPGIAECENRIAGMLVSSPMIVDEGYVEDGLVLASCSLLEEPDSDYICAMAVCPEFRGSGLGHQPLDLAAEKACEVEPSKLNLIVFELDEGTKRLYERSGFTETA